jgi:uncharacterized protein (UPF0332 family)
MIFDWREYLVFAEYIHSNIATEASKRSSVSRSYYSVYHKTRLFCLNTLKIINTFESTGANCHALIHTRLIEQDDEDLFEIANRFHAIKLRRQEADYNAKAEISENYVVDTISKSIQVIELITNFTP